MEMLPPWVEWGAAAILGALIVFVAVAGMVHRHHEHH
jgi:hypothetical protein